MSSEDGGPARSLEELAAHYENMVATARKLLDVSAADAELTRRYVVECASIAMDAVTWDATARALRSYAALRERLESEAVANELIDAAEEIAEAWERSHHPTTAHRLARAFLSSILNPESEAPREQ